MIPSSSARSSLTLAVTHSGSRKVVIRATRPALTDLRLKEDAWLVGKRGGAVLYPGDRRLLQVAATPLDLPSLNRTLWEVRLGQARRNKGRRGRAVAPEPHAVGSPEPSC